MKKDGADYEILLRYLDGELGAADKTQTEHLLRTDAGAREYLREVAQHAVVIADVQRVTSSVKGATATIAKRPPAWVRWSPSVAAVAVVALIVSVFFLRPGGEPEIGAVTGLHGIVKWTGDGGRVIHELTPGQRLPNGTLEVNSPDAWVEFEFRDDSTVTLSGQAALVVSERACKELHLRHGSLSASVPPQPTGAPMLVHTPIANLEVVGTQFNVDANPSATTLAVNEGSVRLERLADGKVVEVPANHEVIASLDEQNGLEVTERHSVTHAWRSALERDAVHGKWTSDLQTLAAKLKKAVINGEITEKEAVAKYKAAACLSNDTGVLYATPMLLPHPKLKNQSKLAFLAVVSVNAPEAGPVVLASESTFRVQGRVESAADVTFGISTYFRGGGFEGKYTATRTIETIDTDGNFDIELSLLEFRSIGAKEKAALVGRELDDWWCYTWARDAKLAITDVELVE